MNLTGILKSSCGRLAYTKALDKDQMKFGSVCSGIEAASVAWENLGWEAQWFSEIEQFPSAVLAHRFPTVPNLGDMTKIHENQILQDATIDLLVGGTPCQSFSVAGLRKGLADPRGNLMLTFLSLAQIKKPRWIVWENVPGVLSSNGGRDFGTFLQGLAELRYGFAYRILDARFFGVPQRRRRVFVVGYLGDWRPPAAVLFESYCLSGDSQKGREKRKTITGDVKDSFRESGIPRLAQTLSSRDHKGPSCGRDGLVGNPIAVPVPHAFKVRGGVEFETGEQGGTPGRQAGKGYLGQDECAYTIGTTQDQQIAQNMAIRRLTPTECERLQEFPDNWTKIPYRNKPEDQCPDGPRYKACGNSMAVPVMRWIGKRIQMVEDLIKNK